MQPSESTSDLLTEIANLRHSILIYKSSHGYTAAVLRVPCGRRIAEEERPTVAEAIDAAATKLNL